MPDKVFKNLIQKIEKETNLKIEKIITNIESEYEEIDEDTTYVIVLFKNIIDDPTEDKLIDIFFNYKMKHNNREFNLLFDLIEDDRKTIYVFID